MNTIALAKKIEFEKGKESNLGRVVIEPLFPGYGITLGNSIRRVLLSSLPGAAATGVKIEGVDHEFMTVPHVKEDVLEIILNIKRMNFKLHSDEVVKLELAAHGKKAVTAGDIKKNSDVEIANPDLVIANITDMAGKLNMEILVSSGMGYVTIESREANIDQSDRKDKEIGFIEVDSIFSPVVNVGTKIDNVRVGKMTNWDKLVIDIETDNTITAEEAFRSAIGILIEQFTALNTKYVVKGDVKEEKEEIEKDEKKKEDKTEKSKEVEDKKESEKEAEEEAPKKKRGRPRKVADESE